MKIKSTQPHLADDIDNEVGQKKVDGQFATAAMLIGFVFCVIAETALVVFKGESAGMLYGLSVFLFFIAALVDLLVLAILARRGETGEHFYRRNTSVWKRRIIRIVGMVTFFFTGWVATEVAISLYRTLTF